MASTKTYRDYILEQLSEIPDLACRPMMGEFLLYSGGVLFSGIYDDRLLIKIAPETAEYHLPKTTPYSGAKPMYLIEDPDDRELLTEIITKTVKSLKCNKS